MPKYTKKLTSVHIYIFRIIKTHLNWNPQHLKERKM